MPSDVIIDSDTVLDIASAGRVNFASAQNAVPILKSVRIVNPTDEPWERLTLHLTPQPAFCRSKTWTIDRVRPQDSASVTDRDLTLDLSFFAGLNEAEKGQLDLRLERDGCTLAETVVPVELLARDEWGGIGEMAQILSAFVSPNDSAVARILKEASRLLEAAGHKSAIDGYQSGDPARVYMLTACGSPTARSLRLSNPMSQSCGRRPVRASL
jgi:hypothetical protein